MKKEDAVVFFTQLLNILAILAATFVVVANIISMVKFNKKNPTPKGRQKSEEIVIFFVLRSYNVVWGLIIFAAEFETPTLFALFKALESWVWRGIWQIFVGFLTLGTCGYTTKKFDKASLYAGWIMAAVGALFVVLGIFGMKDVKENRQRQLEST